MVSLLGNSDGVSERTQTLDKRAKYCYLNDSKIDTEIGEIVHGTSIRVLGSLGSMLFAFNGFPSISQKP